MVADWSRAELGVGGLLSSNSNLWASMVPGVGLPGKVKRGNGRAVYVMSSLVADGASGCQCVLCSGLAVDITTVSTGFSQVLRRFGTDASL